MLGVVFGEDLELERLFTDGAAKTLFYAKHL